MLMPPTLITGVSRRRARSVSLRRFASVNAVQILESSHSRAAIQARGIRAGNREILPFQDFG